MLIIWKSSNAMRISEIRSALKDIHPCYKPAVQTLIKRLSDRGFVKIETVDASTPHKLITPLVVKDDYRAAESKNFVDKLCRGSWKTLIATLVDTEKSRAV